jgi:hypothetical protein
MHSESQSHSVFTRVISGVTKKRKPFKRGSHSKRSECQNG